MKDEKGSGFSKTKHQSAKWIVAKAFMSQSILHLLVDWAIEMFVKFSNVVERSGGQENGC